MNYLLVILFSIFFATARYRRLLLVLNQKIFVNLYSFVLFLLNGCTAINSERKILVILELYRYVHETCATDTNQVQVVINSVIDTIVQENLKDTGMI